MKIQSVVKSKVVPIVAATVLSTGALFAQGNYNYQNNTVHYNNVTKKTNHSLDSLKLLNKDNVINFTDYYEKSYKVIEDAKLNEDILRKECEVDAKDKGFRKGIANLICAFAGLGILISFAVFGISEKWDNLKFEEERKNGYKITGAIAATLALLALAGTPKAINNHTQKNIDNYVEMNQKKFSSYKNNKLKSLEASVEEHFQMSNKN